VALMAELSEREHLAVQRAFALITEARDALTAADALATDGHYFDAAMLLEQAAAAASLAAVGARLLGTPRMETGT
jgi:hypothetical protein